VSVASLFWLTGRVKRIGVENEPPDRLACRDNLRGDPPSHRAAADDQRAAKRPCIFDDRAPRVFEHCRPIRRLPPGLLVWEVKAKRGHSTLSEVATQLASEWVMDVRASAGRISQRPRSRLCPDFDTRYRGLPDGYPDLAFVGRHSSITA
jgi:hypothetical protein